jgi:hypothetical protein
MSDDKAGKELATDEKKKDQATGETLEQWGEAPAKMKKAIQLAVTLHIEGEDAPAHDFSKSTVEAVEEIIAAGSAKHPELKITIKKIAEK